MGRIRAIAEEKICTKCKVLRGIELYNFTNKIKGYRCSICKLCYNIMRAKLGYKTKKRREYDKGKRLKEKYGITMEYYNTMLKEQDGVCKLCKQPERQSHTRGGEGTCRLAVDHNHTTGEIRGLLCSQCNQGLGKFSEDIELLKRAIEYLQK